jgi:hypothetical protein
MSKDITPKQKTGLWLTLLYSVVELVIVAPCWLGLLFGILYTISAPFWLWIIFFVYMPAFIVGKILAKLIKRIFESRAEEKKAEEEDESRFANARVVGRRVVGVDPS